MSSRFLYILLALVMTAIFMIIPEVADAQCPMCKIAAESNLKDGGSAGKGLNTGIFYMLAMPYLIVGTIGFLWWRNNQRTRKQETPSSAV